MCCTGDVLSRLDGTYKQLHARLSTSSTFANANVTIPEVANFCLTTAHETYGSERISSTKMSVIFIVMPTLLQVLDMLLPSHSLIRLENSRITRPYSSATTSDAQPKAERNHLEGLVSRCQEPTESFTPL